MRSRAFALPLVLWSIAFLMGLVLMLAGRVSDWLDRESLAERTFRARQLALNGLALGSHPEVSADDPLLLSGDEKSEGYRVRVTNEAGRVNPNFWVAQQNREIFQRLFRAWQVGLEDQDPAIDGLVDWIDGDDFRSLAGAESAEYLAQGLTGFPANRPLTSVREMEAVIGLAPLLAEQDNWQELFTLWHSGPPNLQYADERLLQALAGLSKEQCEMLFKLRAGADGVEGNKDDLIFQSVDQAAKLLGISGAELVGLQNFFGVTGNVRCVESTGFCYGRKHTIRVVLGGAGGGFLSWEER